MMVQVAALLAFVGSLSAVVADVSAEVAVEQSTPAAEWHSDYGQALAATRADKIPLLVVLEDRSDSQSCLDEALLADTPDQTARLRPYRLCRVDAATEYGKQVAKVFGASQFPTTVIIDKSGAVILHRQAGPMTAEQWSSTLAKHQSGERSARTVQTSFYRGAAPTSQPQFESYPTYGTSDYPTATPAYTTPAYTAPAYTAPRFSAPSISSPSYCPSCQRKGAAF